MKAPSTHLSILLPIYPSTHPFIYPFTCPFSSRLLCRLHWQEGSLPLAPFGKPQGKQGGKQIAQGTTGSPHLTPTPRG